MSVHYTGTEEGGGGGDFETAKKALLSRIVHAREIMTELTSTEELKQYAIASGIRDTPNVLGQQRVNQLVPMGA